MTAVLHRPLPPGPAPGRTQRTLRADHPDARAATARGSAGRVWGRGTCGWDRCKSPRHGLGQPPPRRLRDGDLGRCRTAVFVFLDFDGDEPVETSIETGPDYVFVPPFVPHREVNPDPGTEAVVVIARTTQEAIVVNRRATRLGAGRPVHARGPRDSPCYGAHRSAPQDVLAAPAAHPAARLMEEQATVLASTDRARPGQVFSAHDRARPRLLWC